MLNHIKLYTQVGDSRWYAGDAYLKFPKLPLIKSLQKW